MSHGKIRYNHVTRVEKSSTEVANAVFQAFDMLREEGGVSLADVSLSADRYFLQHPGPHREYRLENSLEENAKKPALSAVLVPLIDRKGEPTVLLTKRSNQMPSHAGQIAFPGGKISATDRNPLDTALREAEEEVGLTREAVNILGFLDNQLTSTGFHITPAVGVIPPNLPLSPQEKEVAEIFEVPLHFLMNRDNHTEKTVRRNGRLHSFYVIVYGPHMIWGATAAIIRNLYKRLGV